MKENDPELRKIRPKLGFAGDISGKESAANAGDADPWDGKIPLEDEVATHSNILAWKFPWKEELCGLQSMGLQKVDKA